MSSKIALLPFLQLMMNIKVISSGREFGTRKIKKETKNMYNEFLRGSYVHNYLSD